MTGADRGERGLDVRADVERIGDRADDLAEQDLIDVVVGMEPEVIDGAVAGRVCLRAIELAGNRRGLAGRGERAEARCGIAARVAEIEPELRGTEGEVALEREPE
ncbi:MAG TPA: hypothetical protein VGC41_04615, partial [Kofleriaceae bacterium]